MMQKLSNRIIDLDKEKETQKYYKPYYKRREDNNQSNPPPQSCINELNRGGYG